MKQVLVVCDSFKGSLSSAQIATIAKETFQSFPSLNLTTSLFADGGEGSLTCAASVIKGEFKQVMVPNAFGVSLPVCYLISKQSAYIEVASVCGMVNLNGHELNPHHASTDGIGWLIRDAIDEGCRFITLFLGGTASVDGGTGMMRALGVQFFDCDNYLIVSANPLISFKYIHWCGYDELLKGVHFEIVCDVLNPVFGSTGGVRIFGPQKGIQPHEIEFFELKMSEWIQQLNHHFGNNHSCSGKNTYSGAAGGVGIPFFYHQACFHLGFDWFFDLLRLEKCIQKADVVVTGEGRIDGQTEMGKGVGRLAQACKMLEKPIFAICGSTDGSCDLFNRILVLGESRLSREESMDKAPELFAEQLVKIAFQL